MARTALSLRRKAKKVAHDPTMSLLINHSQTYHNL